MNKKIIDIIKSLGIDCYYHQVSSRKDKYVIFNIYNEKDTDVFDNKSLTTTYHITLNYWCKNVRDLDLYKQIKKEMKANKFKFNGGSDLIDDDYFGKNLDFIYKEIN